MQRASVRSMNAAGNLCTTLRLGAFIYAPTSSQSSPRHSASAPLQPLHGERTPLGGSRHLLAPDPLQRHGSNLTAGERWSSTCAVQSPLRGGPAAAHQRDSGPPPDAGAAEGQGMAQRGERWGGREAGACQQRGLPPATTQQTLWAGQRAGAPARFLPHLYLRQRLGYPRGSAAGAQGRPGRPWHMRGACMRARHMRGLQLWARGSWHCRVQLCEALPQRAVTAPRLRPASGAARLLRDGATRGPHPQPPGSPASQPHALSRPSTWLFHTVPLPCAGPAHPLQVPFIRWAPCLQSRPLRHAARRRTRTSATSFCACWAPATTAPPSCAPTWRAGSWWPSRPWTSTTRNTSGSWRCRCELVVGAGLWVIVSMTLDKHHPEYERELALQVRACGGQQAAMWQEGVCFGGGHQGPGQAQPGARAGAGAAGALVCLWVVMRWGVCGCYCAGRAASSAGACGPSRTTRGASRSWRCRTVAWWFVGDSSCQLWCR